MFKDDYQAVFSKVTASPETCRRVMHMTKRKKNHRSAGYLGKVLIAAIIVSMLAISASAAESIGGWFVQFFGGADNLSQEQVQFLEDNTRKFPAQGKEDDPSVTHTDFLQFVREEVIFQADANNTHVTNEGDPDYKNFRMYYLTLSPTRARLIYRYFEGMDWTKPCSISHITVVLRSGEEIEMPIAVSKRAMDFVSDTRIPLDEVDHIRLPDGVTVRPLNKVEDDFAISVDCVLTDGQSACITLNVTVPEVIQAPGEGWAMEDFPGFTDVWLCPADQEKPTIEELILWNGSGGEVMEDGDGKSNTQKIVLSMTRSGTEPLLSFGGRWKLHIEGFRASWRHAANEAGIRSQYAGQDYLIDGEEAARFMRTEELCWDQWDFLLDLDGETEKEAQDVELITQPLTLSGFRAARLEELQEDPGKDQYGPFAIQLVSFRISPLSYYIEYTAEDDYNAQTVNVGAYTLVMRDGTEQELTQYAGRHAFTEPILLQNVDHLRLPDGTRLWIP